MILSIRTYPILIILKWISEIISLAEFVVPFESNTVIFLMLVTFGMVERLVLDPKNESISDFIARVRTRAEKNEQDKIASSKKEDIDLFPQVRARKEKNEQDKIASPKKEDISDIGNKDKRLKIISGIATVFAISADLITVGLFLQNLYTGVVPLNIESALPWIFIIILIFIFSILLYSIAKTNTDSLDQIIYFFSWIYVILAAFMFTLISKQFITEANYTIYDYFGYLFLIFLIAGLGFITSIISKNSIRNFSVPFMVVGLYQIILWVLLCTNPKTLVFNLYSFGNALLLGVVGVFIIYCREHFQN